MLFETIEKCVDYISHIEKEKLVDMGQNARHFVKNNLSVKQMANHAISIL